MTVQVTPNIIWTHLKEFITLLWGGLWENNFSTIKVVFLASAFISLCFVNLKRRTQGNLVTKCLHVQ